MAVSDEDGFAAAVTIWLVCTAVAVALGTETMLWISRRINATAPATNSVEVGRPPPVPDGARPSKLESPDALAATAPVGATEVAVADTARPAERITGATTAAEEPIVEDEFAAPTVEPESAGVP